MRPPADLHRQRGELSLFWCVVLFAALALVMMAGLMSWGHERNLFAEWWGEATRQAGGLSVEKLTGAVKSPGAPAAAPSSEVRKCTIKGKVVYSNVECGADNATSRKVETGPALAAPASGPGRQGK